MNIRNLSNPQAPTKVDSERTKLQSAEQMLKTSDSSQRDADGRQGFANNKRKVTPEELQEILTGLRNDPGFKSNSLTVSLQMSHHKQVIIIKNKQNQTVKRIIEDDFIDLLIYTKKDKPRLLNKSA